MPDPKSSKMSTELDASVGGKDMDMEKGAVESQAPGEEDNMSATGQLGHRDEDPMVKSADTDFPEPGENPEHSGEPETSGMDRKAPSDKSKSQPGTSQKENQNQKKDDSLAA
jgi:hypothetical protein